MNNYLDCAQGTKEWFSVRLGCVTSSRIADAISFLTRKSKNGGPGDETKARLNLKWELAAEILSGDNAEHYVSKWMDEGRAKEPHARAAYEVNKGVFCQQVGFAFHPTIKLAGASPDALVGNDGLAEFKCPKTETHIAYLHAGVIPEDYRDQMMWQIACCEREWNDFASYDPTMKDKRLRLFVAPRMYRDENRIAFMNAEVEKFNAEVQELIRKIDPGYIEQQLRGSIRQVNPDFDESLLVTDSDIAI